MTTLMSKALDAVTQDAALSIVMRKMSNVWRVMPIWLDDKYPIVINEKNDLNNFVSRSHATAGDIEKAKRAASGRLYSGKLGSQ